jgi:RNA recognition motif-containing protein
LAIWFQNASQMTSAKFFPHSEKFDKLISKVFSIYISKSYHKNLISRKPQNSFPPLLKQILGTYAFIEFADENDAKVAIKEMDNSEFMGRELNVEIGGKAKRADRSEKVNGDHPDTVKLHISGLKKYNNTSSFVFENFEMIDELCFQPVD